MRAATVVQQLCKSCRTCFMLYCMFCFTCDRSFTYSEIALQPTVYQGGPNSESSRFIASLDTLKIILKICNFLSYRNYCKIKLHTSILERHRIRQQIYRPALKVSCHQLKLKAFFTDFSKIQGDASPV